MGKNIGIDFGTTNTLVSYVDKKGRVVNYKTDDGSETIPSAVFFGTRDEDDWIIGEEAKQAILLDPQAGAENFKSLLGKKDYRYSIIAENGDQFDISPREVARFFIGKIIDMVTDYFIDEYDGESIESVVVSVPAKFNYIERGAIKKAVNDAMATNDSVRIVPESTAAAYAHVNLVEKDNKPETILVYDFGGGTFDVSLLKIMNNGTYCEAVVPGGDKALGGNKLTENIIREIISSIEDEKGITIPLLDEEEEFNENRYGMSKEIYLKNFREIRNKSDRIKELSSKYNDSSERTFSIYLKKEDGSEEEYERTFTKQEVDELIRDDIDRTIKITLQMLEGAKQAEIESVDSVVVAGGSSNITMVKSELEDALDMEITRADNVMTLISRGAALYAQAPFDGDFGITTQTNTEIGIKLSVDNIPNSFRSIIPCGVNVPTDVITEKFHLKTNGQRRVEIEIYERDVMNYPKAKKTNSPGVSWVEMFVIDNLPENLNKDEAYIEISFKINSDGTMDASASVKDLNGYVIENNDIKVSIERDLG